MRVCSTSQRTKRFYTDKYNEKNIVPLEIIFACPSRIKGFYFYISRKQFLAQISQLRDSGIEKCDIKNDKVAYSLGDVKSCLP